MKQGLKTTTSSPKRYGYPGDWFEAFGRYFKIVDVRRLPLGAIARFFYQEEGFETREEFMKLWIKIHPRIGFQSEKPVFFHEFTPARDDLEYHVHELLANRVCQICGSMIAPTD